MAEPSGTIQTKSGATARVVVAPTGVVRVHVSPEVLYNLEAIQELTPPVMALLGCPSCNSGLEVAFRLAEGEL